MIHNLLKVDGVKLALGGADAAADAHILIDDDAAAAEAAGGFLLDLLLGEGTAQILEALLCLLGGRTGGLLAGCIVKADCVDAKRCDIQRLIITVVTAEILGLAGMYIAVDGDGCLFYIVDCLDGLKMLCILAVPLLVFVIGYIT